MTESTSIQGGSIRFVSSPSKIRLPRLVGGGLDRYNDHRWNTRPWVGIWHFRLITHHRYPGGNVWFVSSTNKIRDIVVTVVPFFTIASSTVSHIVHNYLVININLSCSFISISAKQNIITIPSITKFFSPWYTRKPQFAVNNDHTLA
jgi:hypothetical protein